MKEVNTKPQIMKVSANGSEMGVARAMVQRIKAGGYVDAQAINEASLENIFLSFRLANLLLGTYLSFVPSYIAFEDQNHIRKNLFTIHIEKRHS